MKDKNRIFTGEILVFHRCLYNNIFYRISNSQWYHYYYNLLPSSFENFFQTVASIHSYNTRLASKSTYYINTIKTNHGKFNIRFAAVKVWNHLDESIKHLPLKVARYYLFACRETVFNSHFRPLICIRLPRYFRR